MVKQAVCKYYRRKRGGAQLNCYHVRRTRVERGKETRRKEEKKKKRISNNVISDRAIRLTSRKSSSQWPLTRDIHASTLTQQHSSSVGPCSNSQLFYFGQVWSNCSTALFSSFFVSFFHFSNNHSLKFHSQDSLNGNYFCKHYLLFGRRRHFASIYYARYY